MFMDWNRRQTVASTLLFVCAFLFLVLLVIGFVRRNDIKGTYFTDPAALSRTAGIITSSEVICRNPKGGKVYEYSIRYKFRVNEKELESDRITFAPPVSNQRGFAEAYVSKYPVGKEITVFYEKDNPSFSVLEPEEKDESVLKFFLGGALFITVVFIWAAFNFFRSPF
jgi:hypothetical protein